MKRVLTYGTFDLLHTGHLNILRRAREMGGHLTVALSTDAFNAIKHKEAVMPYAARKAVLEALRYVDAVIPEKSWSQKKHDIRTHNIDILVMGEDWRGAFDDLASLCKVVYLSRTPRVSTTLIKKRLKDAPSEKTKGLVI
jgi:glycerol-3-phosphate cytidylyltransferase